MLLEAKKRNKRNEPRTRLDSTSEKKERKEKKPSRERNIKLDRTGSATRKTEFTAEDSATQQDFGHFKMAGKVLRPF